MCFADAGGPKYVYASSSEDNWWWTDKYVFEMKICGVLYETDKVLIGKVPAPFNDTATMQIFQAVGNLRQNLFRYTDGILFIRIQLLDVRG